MKSKLILIAGGTASGKSLVAYNFANSIIRNDTTLIKMDNYYKTIDMLGVKDGSNVNWDVPDVFDWDKFYKDINDLMDGKIIYKEDYDFITSKYKKKKIEYKPSKYIIIEGLFALYEEKIRDLANLKIFVDADSDKRLIRRIERDKKIRKGKSFNIENFIFKWVNEIKPMHKKYIKPTMEYADFILKNNKNNNLKEEKEILSSLL